MIATSQNFLISPERKVKIVFWGLLILTIIFPIFLGGNRPLPWSVMSLSTGFLLTIWSVAAYQKPALSKISLRHIWFIVAPFILVMIWIIFQGVLLGGTNLAHPIWSMTENILGNDVSSALTLDPYKTLEGFMRLLTYGVIFWLALQLGRSSSNAKIMLLAIAFASGLYAIYGIYIQLTDSKMIFFDYKRVYVNSVSSTFINRNSYATFAGIGIIVSLALFLSSLFKNMGGESNSREFYLNLITNFARKSFIFLVLIIVLISALIMTNSRAGIASVAIGCLSFMVLFCMTKQAKNNRLIISIFTLIVAVIFTAGLSLKGDILSKRLLMAEHEMSIRSNIYNVTSSAIADFPIYGSGLGTFENVFSFYRDTRFPKEFTKRMDHAHNTYLETILELGIPAFSLLAISVIIILIICLRGVVKRKRNAVFPAIAVAVSIIIWSHALFDFSIEMPAIAVTYAIILGIGCAQSWSTRQNLSDEEA